MKQRTAGWIVITMVLVASMLVGATTLNGQTVLADSYLTSLSVASPTTLNSSLNFPSYLDGALTGSDTLTHTGYFGGQVSLVNNGAGNTFTGNINVDSGTLRIAGSPFASNGGFTAPSMTSGNTITINRAGTLTIDDNVTGGYTANRFGSSGNYQAVTLAGGAINLSGLNNASSSVQTLGALTSSSGQGTITVTRNSNGNPTLTFGSLTINSGSLLTFNGTALGTGANDARITFTSAPTLNDGILAAARFYSGAAGTSGFVTYSANGVREFTASDFTIYAANDINLATSGQNVQMTGAVAPVALTGNVTVNSLNYNGTGGTWSLGGYTLTIDSGMLLRNGNNSAIDISNGTLTAGNGTDDIDLNVIVAQQNMTISAVIADNSASAVTLVKIGDSRSLTLNGGANNTYSGGTYVVGGTLSLGNVANRTYLGTGKATVDGSSELTLGNIGATSNAGGDDYTAINGGKINIASGANGAYTANDTFNIAANSIIAGGSASGQGLASLTRNSNVTLTSGAIIGHSALTAALNLTTGTIQGLGAAADIYYGLNADQNNVSGSINIGSGTAFKGISTDRSAKSWLLGTINIASDTTSVDFQGHATHGAAVVLTLGNGGTANAPDINFAGSGTVDIRAIGALTLNDSTATFGDTGANVRFVSTAGSTLTVTAADGMGSGTGIASALVQNGGSLAIGNTTALNGNITVQAGGRLVASQAAGLTGAGALTFNEGSILEISNATGFSGAQAASASVAAGTIVRVGVAAGTAGATLDSFLGSKSPIYQLTGDIDVPEPSLPGTTTMTLNKNGSGVGGIVINGSASAFFRNNANGQVTLGANGGVMAATTGTELQVQENIVGTGVTLTIGTTDIIDGAPKRGSVALGSAANSNTYTGETIINAGTLRQGYANVLGALANQLTVNTGGTLNMNGQALTVGNLTGTGGIINGGGTLTIGQGNNGGGNYQGSIQANNVLTKTGAGTITLSGANTYSGLTTASGTGTLILSGANTSSGATTVSGGGTLVLDYSSQNNSKLADGAALTLSSGAGNITLRGGSHVETVGSLTIGSLGGHTSITREVGSTAKIAFNAISRSQSGYVTMSLAEDGLATTTSAVFNGILTGGITIGSNWAKVSSGDIVALTAGDYTTLTAAAVSTTVNYQLTGSLSRGAVSLNSLRIVSNGDDQVLNMGAGNFQASMLASTLGNGAGGGILYAGGGNNSYTITGGGTLNGQNGNQELPIHVHTGTLTVDMIIATGLQGFSKAGEGTLVLTKANTYTGPTYVNQGTVLINSPGSLSTGSVNVWNRASLGGSGTIGGAVTVNTGGILQPSISGSNGNTLTLSSATAPTFSSGSILKIRAPSSTMDKVSLSAATTLNITGMDLVIDTTSLSGNVSSTAIVELGGASPVITGPFRSVTVTNNPNYVATLDYSTAGQVKLALTLTGSAFTGSLAAVNTTYGTASPSPTSFNVFGGTLSPSDGNLTVTPPAGFEVSLSSDSGYSTSLLVPYVGVTLASTTIYVRLAATTGAGSYSGNITITGGGGAPVTVPTVSSTVSKAPLTITPPTVTKIHDGTTSPGTVTVGTLSGFVNGETVTATGTATDYASAELGSSYSVTVTYTLHNGTGLAANYSLASEVINNAAIIGGIRGSVYMLR